jgi:peptidoglycan-associated lipoprotein
MDTKQRLLPSTVSVISRSVLALLIALPLAFSGCATTSETEDPAPADTGSEFSDASATADVEVVAVEVVEWTNPGRVHFEFDSSEIRADAIPVLEAAAEQLNATGMTVILAGYCDNRGTEEYNLALGDRRAAAVRRYLTNLGVPAAQMMVVSYGELRPLRRDNNEAAWAANRRVEFEPAG